MYSGSFRDAKLYLEILAGLMFSEKKRKAPSEEVLHTGHERARFFISFLFNPQNEVSQRIIITEVMNE
jgi:hypothetical protein